MYHLPEPNSQNSSQRHQSKSPVAIWSAIAIILTTAVASAVAFSYSSKPKSPTKSLAKNQIAVSKPKDPNIYNNYINVNPIHPPANNSVINNKNILRSIPVKPAPIVVRNEPNSNLNSSLPVPENNNLEKPVAAAPSPSQTPQSTSTFIHQEEKENNKQAASLGEKTLQRHLPVTTNFNNQLKAERQASALQVNSRKQTTSPATKRRLELSLPDVVALALQNNRDLKNAYLERIAQRADLEVAESKFKPTLTPSVQIYLDQAESAGISRASGNVHAAATVSLKLPTGADITFGWQANTQNSTTAIATNNDVRQNLVFQFNQPLLRGGGIDLNRASIDLSRASEQINILGLKSTLTNTINSAIFAYRDLLRAQEQVKIEELSLASSNESLELVQVLIQAGRKAPVDIVQNQTAIANRQVSLVETKKSLETVKIELLKILDIADEDIDIVAVENLTAKPRELNLAKLKEIALANRSDYLQAQLQVDRTKFERLIAENNQLWNLDFFANYDNEVDNIQQFRTGLRLSRTLGDRNLKSALIRTQINLRQAENNLEELRQTIELEVIDEVKNVNSSYQQLNLAQQARELAERKLAIEREKLRLGRSDIFEIVSFQEDLVAARNSELNANINYLNELIRLDRTVGTTLQTWQVTVEPRS